MIEENVTLGGPTNGEAMPYLEPRVRTPRVWGRPRLVTRGTELPPGQTDETASSFEAPGPLEEPSRGLSGRARLRLWQEVVVDFEHIRVDPAIMRGQPVIAGTRIPVYLIVSLAAEGRSPQQIVDFFEGDVSLDSIQEALHFAADLAR